MHYTAILLVTTGPLSSSTQLQLYLLQLPLGVHLHHLHQVLS